MADAENKPMIKSDTWILGQAAKGMIQPFIPELVRQTKRSTLDAISVISYGVSSFGYDIRLSARDFRIFRHQPGEIVDPKTFDPQFLEQARLRDDTTGSYFILPGHTYGLGVAVEHLSLPNDILVIAIGKSTYARAGVIANTTPAEPGWRGHLTLEFSNSSDSDVKIYANEGVIQLLFLQGEPCATSYANRSGKYQDQPEQVVCAR